ncbi:hypothetical protein F4861DRAFT_298672 [Xylaria intraflava]|nr:hypothetical protein F4861DRAFT_298672 [Xylaria intraflava]
MKEKRSILLHDSDNEASKSKRRRVRKGTRSCWECRRRKIRCFYSSDDAPICTNCTARGTSCVSQEFPDEQSSAPDQLVTQRLVRVEEMLEKLVERIMPDSYTTDQECAKSASPSSPASADALDPPSVEHECFLPQAKPPLLEPPVPLRGQDNLPIVCPSGELIIPESNHPEAAVLSPKYEQVSKTIHGLFPCRQDIDTIVAANSGDSFVISFFSPYGDKAEGNTEDPACVGTVPDIGSHPVVLARRLMQLTHCIQQLHPKVVARLVSMESPRCWMAKYASTVLELVAYNDDLVGYAEGIETLTLLSMYHATAGNLRKAWLITRRTLSIAQLMNIDKYGDRPLKYADPKSNPATRLKAKTIWFRVNFLDRYLSLTLGLPAGVDDNSFLTDEPSDGPADKLEKQHAIVMGAIIKRNSCKGTASSFSTTQAIDCDLEKAARRLSPSFWQRPSASAFTNANRAELTRAVTRLMLHMHHYNLLILLHLPYMLRDPKERRWDYSKATCISSSRTLLHTFLLYHKVKGSLSTCRHTDYGALTASMTLVLAYLDPKLQAQDQTTTSSRAADRALIKGAQDKLLQRAEQSNDKLSRDAASLIGRLSPLLNPELMKSAGQSEGNEGAGEVAAIHLDIPYLGSIHINPTSTNTDNPQYDVQPGQATPGPDANTSIGIISTAPTAPTKATPENTDLNRHEYAIAPSFPTASHIPPYWSVPSNQQHFTPAGGDAGAEASHMLLEPYGSTEYPDFSSFAPTMQFEWSQAQLAHPDLAAEADEWTFQGFDATYFESLFSSGSLGPC